MFTTFMHWPGVFLLFFFLSEGRTYINLLGLVFWITPNYIRFFIKNIDRKKGFRPVIRANLYFYPSHVYISLMTLFFFFLASALHSLI